MRDWHAIGQLQNNPTTPGTPSRDRSRTLPCHQGLAFFRSEMNRQGCFTSTSHTATSNKGLQCSFYRRIQQSLATFSRVQDYIGTLAPRQSLPYHDVLHYDLPSIGCGASSTSPDCWGRALWPCADAVAPVAICAYDAHNNATRIDEHIKISDAGRKAQKSSGTT